MKWFDANPHGANPGLRGEAMWEAHTFARNNFSSSFARGGGFVSTAFAPTATEALKAPWRRRNKVGSIEHISNLRKMQAARPKDANIANAIKKAERGPSNISSLKTAGRFALGGAFIAMPALLTPGSGQEKARATAGAAVGQIGWELGSRAGMGIGAATLGVIPGIGAPIGAVVGAIAGGLAGAIGLDEGFQALTRIPDRMVERERARRNLNWKGDTTAFMTQSAHTMRQQSLQAMNRGQQTARSMLGREGVMLHQ